MAWLCVCVLAGVLLQVARWGVAGLFFLPTRRVLSALSAYSV